MKDRDFDLYRTEDGTVVITTPAHRRILNALRQGERSFGEVVEATGKAKSTVSIHLNRMVDQGLVSAREDEDDARRRFFKLEAEPVLTASPDRMSTGAAPPDHLDAEGLLQALSGRFARAGLTVQPLFRQVGRDVAARLGTALADAEPSQAARNVAQFWSKWGLGRAEVNGSRVRVDPAAWLAEPGLHPEELFQGLLEGAFGEPSEPGRTTSVRIVEAADDGFTLAFGE